MAGQSAEESGAHGTVVGLTHTVNPPRIANCVWSNYLNDRQVESSYPSCAGRRASLPRFLPSPAGLSRRFASDISEVSRFSCIEFRDVLGVPDYSGPTSNSR
jgi:hypothetical protein